MTKNSNGIETTYTYTPTTVTQTVSGGATTVYPLNSQGLSTANGAVYDAAGYMIHSQSAAYADDRTIVNGNITIEKQTFTDGHVVTFTVTYGNGKNLDYGNYFQGKQNTNWKMTQIQTDGNTTSEIDYSYQFDGCDRVVKQTSSGAASGVVNYTYY